MSHDFLIEEWRELRKEAQNLVSETRLIEKLAVGATGTVYAWLIANANEIEDYHFLHGVFQSSFRY